MKKLTMPLKDRIVYDGDHFYKKGGKFFHARTGKQMFLVPPPSLNTITNRP